MGKFKSELWKVVGPRCTTKDSDRREVNTRVLILFTVSHDSYFLKRQVTGQTQVGLGLTRPKLLELRRRMPELQFDFLLLFLSSGSMQRLDWHSRKPNFGHYQAYANGSCSFKVCYVFPQYLCTELLCAFWFAAYFNSVLG